MRSILFIFSASLHVPCTGVLTGQEFEDVLEACEGDLEALEDVKAAIAARLARPSRRRRDPEPVASAPEGK